MKKLVTLLFITSMLMASSAQAVTWYVDGVLFGNVCRNGAYYTVYAIYNGQPVGSACPVRDPHGYVIAQGEVTAE